MPSHAMRLERIDDRQARPSDLQPYVIDAEDRSRYVEALAR